MQSGLGIGLTLTRRLVEMHGGRIEARSEGVGRGSEFILSLPLAEPVAEAPGETGLAEPAVAPRRRVLVVDDDRDVADSFVMLLGAVNQDVRVAYDGRSALTIAADFRPEIVFLDLGMPGMDGFETAAGLRLLPDGPQALVVAVTGWGQAVDLRRTREAGFDSHLTKPVEFGLLAEVLSRRR